MCEPVSYKCKRKLLQDSASQNNYIVHVNFFLLQRILGIEGIEGQPQK